MAKIEYDETGLDRVVLSARTHMSNLASMESAMTVAAGLVYEATRQWYDSAGEGTWPKLAPATIRSKASQGAADPERILYAEGNLYESATSPNGPYSYYIPMHDGVVIGVLWTAAKALAGGSTGSGAGHRTVLPPRPIFPPPFSTIGLTLTQAIGEVLLRGHTSLMHSHLQLGGHSILPSMVTKAEQRPGHGPRTLGTYGRGVITHHVSPAWPGANVGRHPTTGRLISLSS